MKIKYKLPRAILPLVASLLCAAAVAETAIVNTPGDGFLALRSEPSTQRGETARKNSAWHDADLRTLRSSHRWVFVVPHNVRCPARLGIQPVSFLCANR
jgi:hypothetical protein